MVPRVHRGSYGGVQVSESESESEAPRASELLAVRNQGLARRRLRGRKRGASEARAEHAQGQVRAGEEAGAHPGAGAEHEEGADGAAPERRSAPPTLT